MGFETFKNGWPVLVEMGRVLPGPPDVVWRLLTDWEHQGDWMLEAKDFRVVSPYREGLGVEGEAVVTIAGITTRDRVVVTAWEPSARLAVQHTGWVSGEAEMLLTPLAEEHTHIYWREKLFPPLGALGGLGLSVLRPLMKRVFERDLRVLGGLVRAAHTS